MPKQSCVPLVMLFLSILSIPESCMSYETMKVGLAVCDQIILENVKLGCTSFMGAHSLSQLGISSYADSVSRQIIHNLRTYVLSEKTKEEEVTHRFRYPANWWEHLKYDKAPQWFLKKFPVKWKYEKMTTKVKHYQCVPMFSKVLDPREQKHTFQTMNFEPAYQASFPDHE